MQCTLPSRISIFWVYESLPYSDMFSCIDTFVGINIVIFISFLFILQTRGYVGRGLREGVVDNVK
jgi:hypothetical protein